MHSGVSVYALFRVSRAVDLVACQLWLGGTPALTYAANDVPGRLQIMTRYRSYHGGTVATLAMSGDQRRWPAEAGANGHVHFFDPFPYSFSMGATEKEVAYRSLDMYAPL